jgi:hypothetical protein
MNYIPFVCYGLCPGGTATQIANYFASWGLIGDLPSPTIITLFLRKLLGVGI